MQRMTVGMTDLVFFMSTCVEAWQPPVDQRFVPGLASK